MKYVNSNFTVNIDWNIQRGASRMREDFRRATLFVFLIGHDNVYPVTYTLEDNVIKAVIEPGLPEGVYGLKAVWFKDQHHPCELRHAGQPFRNTVHCGKRSQSQIDNVFGVTALAEESESLPENTLHVKLTSAVATYGYDGLSAYEIAIMSGETTLSQSEWVGNIAEANVKLEGIDERFESLETRTGNLFTNVSNKYYEADMPGADGSFWYDSTSLTIIPAGGIVRRVHSAPDVMIIDADTNTVISELSEANPSFTTEEQIRVYFGGDSSFADNSSGQVSIDRPASKLHDVLSDIYMKHSKVAENITTDRISDGSVTSEKIATSAFDDTLSISGKIAPADVVGEELTELKEKIDALALGVLYGYFPDSASLPTDVTTPGYAYVGLDNPYKIWNFNGKSWFDSGTSIDMNDADEEDITRNTDGKLQFKDRAYGDGMGYVILRKDKTFAEQVTQANTIYEIRYDFDLNNEDINIENGSILHFIGGSIKNGTLNNATIDYSGNCKIFTNVNFDRLYSLQDVRPEWFGAKGDGKADDTEAVRMAFFVCNYKDGDAEKDGCRLFCNPKKFYKITGNINHYNGKDYALSLNCVGNIPPFTTSYNHNTNLTFVLTEGISMFQNATISGNLSNCKIVTQNFSVDNTYIFNNCNCKRLDFSYNVVDRVESFLYDTGTSEITKIHDNRIVSEYFAKVDKTNSGLVDSFIFNNHISGDVGRTANIDNYCFGWYTYNGSIIRSNFIDFFNCIYSPQVKDNEDIVLSIGNQYQVFKYFYTINSGFKDSELKTRTYGTNINSTGDSFNWLDPETVPFLKLLKPYYHRVEHFEISTKSVANIIKEIPPYIVCTSSYSLSIRNANIEGHIREFIYWGVAISSVKNYKVNVDFIRKPTYSNGSSFIIEKSDSYYPYYNSKDTNVDVCVNEYDILDALPEIKNSGLWCNYPFGYKVKVGKNIYRLILRRFTNGKVKFDWELTDSIVIEDRSFGVYQSKPTNAEIGSSYFCTDRQTSEGASNGIMIYYKGDNVWVDALGRVVS